MAPVERTSLTRAGLPLVARLALALQILALALTAPFYAAYGLSVNWQSVLPAIGAPALLIVLWVHYRRYPGSERETVLPDVALATVLILTLTDILSPAQYLAVAVKRPLVDPYLAAADTFLGVHVPSLAAWTRAHPTVSELLTLSYFTLLPQFALPLFVLGVYYRDRERLWEYVFHFHLCAIVTVASLAIFPAACAFTFYGFESTINQARFVEQFAGFRDGRLTVIDFRNLEGLVSMPSFHAAGALMVTWAFRRRLVFLIPLVVLNSMLLAATVMSGAHYLVDLLATVAMALVSLGAYRVIQHTRGQGRAADR